MYIYRYIMSKKHSNYLSDILFLSFSFCVFSSFFIFTNHEIKDIFKITTHCHFKEAHYGTFIASMDRGSFIGQCVSTYISQKIIHKMVRATFHNWFVHVRPRELPLEFFSSPQCLLLEDKAGREKMGVRRYCVYKPRMVCAFLGIVLITGMKTSWENKRPASETPPVINYRF